MPPPDTTYDLAAPAAALRGGGVVLLPTDTVYGLAVHPEQPAAIDRLFLMKGRPGGRNLPIMVDRVERLDDLGVLVGDAARRLGDAFWPGPLTLALGIRPGAAPSWLAGRDEIGVRIPDDPALRGLLAAVGPLLVTSANAHGRQTPETVAEVLTQLAQPPDLVLDGGPRPVVPSTLVNCNLPEPAIERSGAIPDEDVRKVLS
jgi:L-threonylcarbamoyladenylate synthase